VTVPHQHRARGMSRRTGPEPLGADPRGLPSSWGASWRFPSGCVSRGCSWPERWRWPPRPSPGAGGTRRTGGTEAAESSPAVRRARPPRGTGRHRCPPPPRHGPRPTATRTRRTSPTARTAPSAQVPPPAPLLRRANGSSRARRGCRPAPTRRTPTASRTRPAATTGSVTPPSAGPSSTASRPRRPTRSGGCCAASPRPVSPCRASGAAAGRRRPSSTPRSPGGPTPARGGPRTPCWAGCSTSTGGTPAAPYGWRPPPAVPPPASTGWPVSTPAATARRCPARRWRSS